MKPKARGKGVVIYKVVATGGTVFYYPKKQAEKRKEVWGWKLIPGLWTPRGKKK